MKMKKMLAMLLATCMLCTIGLSTFAANRISPYSIYVNSNSAELSISSGIANAKSKLEGTREVTRVQTYITLEKKSGSSWTAISSYDETVYSNISIVKSSTSVARGTYRAKATCYAYTASGRYEIATTYSSEVTY